MVFRVIVINQTNLKIDKSKCDGTNKVFMELMVGVLLFNIRVTQ